MAEPSLRYFFGTYCIEEEKTVLGGLDGSGGGPLTNLAILVVFWLFYPILKLFGQFRSFSYPNVTMFDQLEPFVNGLDAPQ